jgi:hypothetical protein
MNSIVVQMSVAELMQYREFDRETEPAPFCFGMTRSLEDVTKWLMNGGEVTIDNPIELSVYRHMALLTDGNHRVLSLHKMNVQTVWVRVTYYKWEELTKAFYNFTLKRFKTIAA